MKKKFCCDNCKMSFSSASELTKHFRTRKHRVDLTGGAVDSIMGKFAERFYDKVRKDLR